jgi:uncharacterized membrane protein
MRKWISPALVLGAFIFSTVVFPELPERMATHWNLAGKPDRWSGRTVAAFFTPTVMLFTLVFLRWLPTIDPRREGFIQFLDAYGLAIDAIILFFAGLHVAMLGEALGWPVSLVTALPVGVGLLLVVLGSLLPRARPNFAFGIRTPWTLSSDRVWERTHRVGGYVLSGSGALIAILALILPKSALPLLFLILLAAALGTVWYSYAAYQEETGSGVGGPGSGSA